jgi:hypothetical protein
MPIVNADIAAVFEEIADLLDLQGANAFRIRAYRNAARMLSELGRSVKTMVDRGEDLDALPGIGADLAGKIAEVCPPAHASNWSACAGRCRRRLPLAGLEGARPRPAGESLAGPPHLGSCLRRSACTSGSDRDADVTVHQTVDTALCSRPNRFNGRCLWHGG